MSREVLRLVETEPRADALNWLEFVPPEQVCECGAALVVDRVHFHGGIHSGATWSLHCPEDSRWYEWQDYVCAAEEMDYDCGGDHL